MTFGRKLIAALVALTLSFTAVSSQASTPVNTKFVEGTDAAAALYNPLVVNRINLEMPASTIRGLDGTTNNWANEGPYLPATMSGVVNGVAFPAMAVGVRLKGAWGSWRNIYGKPGFKIKVDFVDKNATFFGVKKLTLNNMVQDPSSVHETMAYRLFRAVGVSTARTGYTNVFVNGQNYGLRLNLETVDTTLLKRWNIQPLHIYKGGVPHFPDLWPGSEHLYAVDQGSVTDKSDLTALMAVVGRGNGPNWFADMSAVADLEQMTLNWAAEKFTGHWDGYVNNHNNFYLVRRQDGKFIMLPWGMDQTWNGGLDYWSGSAMLSQCINDAKCLRLYQNAIAKVANTAQDLDLPGMSREVATVINPHLLADPKKEFGNDQIPGNQVYSRNFIISQISQALNMVRDIDAELKTFSADGYRSMKPGETLVVPNNVASIQLNGTPYSSNAFAESLAVNLAVGVNEVAMTVTNRRSNNKKTFTIKVHRLALASKTSSIRFVTGKSSLTTTAAKIISTAAKSMPNAQYAILTIRMQQPDRMNRAAAITLLKARQARIESAYRAAGLKIVKTKLELGPVTGKDTLTLRVNYQR